MKYSKKYGDKGAALAVIQHIKDGTITGSTAYLELMQIKADWSGTNLADEAEYLIDLMFSKYKYKKDDDDDTED